MTTTITVQLDVDAVPPVTVDNPDQPVEVSGTSAIQWVRAPGQSFTFTSLVFAAADCPIKVNHFDPGVTVVTANDDNTSPGTYSYHIVVDFEGTHYHTGVGPAGDEDDPSIENEDLPPTR